MNSCAVLMNAHRANRFQLRATTFSLSAALVTGDCDGSGLAFAATSTAAGLPWATAALASQGPGGGSGHRWHFPQLAMAVVVYGASALVVGAGLIGTEKRPN